MKKLYILLAIFAVLSGIPAAQADTQQTIRILADQAEKDCVAKPDFYRLQVPIIGCTPSDTVCCSSDGVYTIALKGAPSYVATMIRFGIIVVITIMFLMLIVSGIQFQLSFGDTSAAYKSLDRVKRAAMGLVVVLFSTVILYQVNPDLIKLKLPTPEEVAQTVCCRIQGVKQIISQTGIKSTSTIVSQTANADHTVSVKWSGGETSLYTRNAYNTKICQSVHNDAAGKLIKKTIYEMCPSNIKFPPSYTNQEWDVTTAATPTYPAGTTEHYIIDPGLNTCKFTTYDNYTKLFVPGVLDCSDDTPVPDTSPALTWKQLLDLNIAAGANLPATLPAFSNLSQSSASDKYYVATNMVNGKFACNGSDQVEPDSKMCFSPSDVEEDVGNPLTDYGQLAAISGDNILVTTEATDPRTLKENVPLIQKAAAAIKSQNIQLWLTSGFRTFAKQQELIKLNCPAGATLSSQCNPPTALHGSPHNAGKAVDVWGAQNGAQCISRDSCKADTASCFKLPCQRAVIDAMKAQGFCVLKIEPWHFENPKVSAGCGNY